MEFLCIVLSFNGLQILRGILMNKSIVLADSYFDSYDRLDKKSRKITRLSLKQFVEDERGNGFKVHDLKRSNCDKTFKSARINEDLRMIFSQRGNQYIVLYVDRHDDAYNWAEGKFLNINNFGALYVHDARVEVQQAPEYKNQFAFGDVIQKKYLLEKQNVSKKDLVQIGVSEVHAEYLISMHDEDKFMDFITVFTQELQEGLIDLVTGSKNITQVYADLQDNETSSGVDELIGKSLFHKDSKRRFYILEDATELDYLLDEDIERWKVFLHPKQEFLVKQNFNGPALVEGGPGTGKTIVGIHRAVYLAKNKFPYANQKLLICTYSKKLANYLSSKVEDLCKQKGVNSSKIEVRGIDSLLYQLAADYKLHSNNLVNSDQILTMLRKVHDELKPKKPLHFYVREYEEVIQRKGIRNIIDYLRVDRKGLGESLNPAQREVVWTFFEKFIMVKNNAKIMDFEDLAFIVYNALKQGLIQPMYESIIIDEAQDLTPLRIKLLASLTNNKTNNLFVLSDQNQRVFRLNGWRKDVNINIVGRTYYLSLNYRTTKQIREFADRQFIESKMDQEYLKEYKSLISGPEPILKEFYSKKQQYSFLVQTIKKLVEKGIHPSDIAIITPFDLKKISGVLEYEDIHNTILEKDTFPTVESGISISTLHGCKGLEFRYIFLPNYDEINIGNLSEDDSDWYQNLKKNQLECLKYVAITRAREQVIISVVDE
jgi:superfamily I DNA/RNA helicase